jgi:flagellar protein FlaE
MTIDPREYDPDELRHALEGGDKNLREIADRMADHEHTAEEGLRSAQLKQLLLMESSAPADALERPYLEAIPGKYAAEITLFEWLDFLLGRVGVRETLAVVDYYESIGWLGSPAAAELRDHARGFEQAGSVETKELDMADHVLSLVYIARLSAMAR